MGTPASPSKKRRSILATQHNDVVERDSVDWLNWWLLVLKWIAVVVGAVAFSQHAVGLVGAAGVVAALLALIQELVGWFYPPAAGGTP